MEIVIYDASWSPSPALPLLGKFSRQLGTNLLIVAFAAAVYASSPFLIREIQYRFIPKQGEVIVNAGFGQIIREEQISKQKLASEEAKQYGINTDFSLVIPKIDAKAQIVPNVDPSNKEEYLEALKQGVAHSYGTSFPGNKGTIYLFSHSTNADYNIERFNAVFYLLKELEPQDKIIIFYAGLKHEYQVIDKQTVEADDISWLTSDPNEERLILQTCWPPGTSLKRLIVIAKPI